MVIFSSTSCEIYSYEQLIKYFNRINYFKSIDSYETRLPEPSYETLKNIAECHTRSIAFGNLSFHYYHKLSQAKGNAPTHPFNKLTTQGVSVDHQDIFAKVVEEERDGCCFENNMLAYWILRCLGFECYLIGGRGVDYGLWLESREIHVAPLNHAFILINLEGEEYILDLGLHIGSTAVPIKLELDLIQKSSCLTEHRIVQRPYPEAVEQTKSGRYNPYVLEVRHSPITGKKLGARNEWCPIHYFQPNPIYISDVEIFNNQLLSDPKNVFYRLNFMAINTSEGYIMYLNGIFKIYSLEGCETIITKDFAHRKQLFKKYFKVNLPEKDCEYIKL